MTTEPTTTQYEQYDRMLAANVDEDIAAYLAGLTECGCVLPEHSCRACRAQARYYREEQTLDELLSMESKVVVTSLGDRITVACAPEAHARVVDCWRGLKALIDSGHYREWACHVGGRALERHIAEPVEGAATGPTFTRDHPESWKVVEQ